MMFRCNLVENARKHKHFLQQLHDLDISTKASNALALHRYQHQWLPLVHQYPAEQLIPPPDIAWLWHCHRLAPKNYITYIESTFGKGTPPLEANPPFTFQFPDSECVEGSVAAKTRSLWAALYPKEPFFLTGQPSTTIHSDFEATPLCGFDLLASTERQATFLWQVSGERFDDDEFLEEGLQNYVNFLKLKPKATKEGIILVPTYQIDLIWHTHILSSITQYNKECTAIMGGTLHHDDSLTDRSEGGVLDVAFTATKNLWKREYGCDYVVVGGMYRGEPPKAYFQADWSSSPRDLEFETSLLHLIGKVMGASSTSPPSAWAIPGGKTSDGNPAFIASGTTERLELKNHARLENYVLGRTAKHGVGYYHIETQEANAILSRRVNRRVVSLEWSKCCCGSDPSVLARKEKDLAEMKKAQGVLRERANAARPSDVSRNTGTAHDPTYYGYGGDWYYPDTLYLSAGGACGGAIACDGAAGCGGSACGAGKFNKECGAVCGGGCGDGGGCGNGGGGGDGGGGGGCGGGGCGGGGCGGED